MIPKPTYSRTPHGVRELKQQYQASKLKEAEVAPHTGCVN